MRQFLLGFILLFQTAPARPVTELRFDWPHELVARVEAERTRERQGDRPSSTTVRGSNRMRVVPHPEGLSIKYDEFRFQGVPTEQAALVETVTSMSPSLIVGLSGDFRRVEDIASVKAGINQLLSPLLGNAQTPAGFQDFVKQFLTDEVLTGFAAQEWEILVGSWRGLPLTTERIESNIEAPTPIWPDVKVPMKVTIAMIERTDCTRGGIRRDCAVVENQSIVNQAAMEPILKRLMQGMGVQAQGVTYERFDAVTVTRVRLETETMLPHELTMTRTVELTVNVPKQGRTAGRQIDRRTMRFTYQP